MEELKLFLSLGSFACTIVQVVIISNFHKIAPNFTYLQNTYFLKYIYNFLDQLLHPYKVHGKDMSGSLFFIFARCEPLNNQQCLCVLQF